ncbi:MAG TPA: BON domain-containing protein [Candidatus Angelobacter sp.]|nr:BON domain-containing protein [Candidatus Angelobacter sp.]
MKARISLYLSAIVVLCALAGSLGCAKAPTDAQITSDIQNRLNSDSGLQGKQLAVQADKGSVTLSGQVDNDAQRDAAARYASAEPGVKQVVNNLQVAPSRPVVEAAQAPPPEQPKPAPVAKPKRVKPKKQVEPPSAPVEVAQEAPPSTPTPTPAPVTPEPPPPPPPPQKVTVPSGTTLAVRLVDAIDSETAVQGQTFHATLNSPLAVEGNVAIPTGYNVEGHIVTVQSAGKFAGQSLLVLQLDRISAAGSIYNIQTDQYKKEGSSRGKNTAAKVGAGAGIGAIIGAIAGGGKGAAIGAAAGGGLGAGAQAITKGQQIKLPSETVLNFTLQAPLTVTPTMQGPNAGRAPVNP